MPLNECEYTSATTSIEAYPTQFCLAKTPSKEGIWFFLSPLSRGKGVGLPAAGRENGSFPEAEKREARVKTAGF